MSNSPVTYSEVRGANFAKKNFRPNFVASESNLDCDLIKTDVFQFAQQEEAAEGKE